MLVKNCYLKWSISMMSNINTAYLYSHYGHQKLGYQKWCCSNAVCGAVVLLKNSSVTLNGLCPLDSW